MKLRNSIVGPGLWVVAASASALSLGGSRGTVVLGAPIDLAFEVQPDAGADVASSCIAAKVLAGDTPIADNRVRVTPLPEAAGRAPAVRVQVPTAVDEPVVTVTLSAGCSGRKTRTYTFLTELPAAVARSTSPVDVSRLGASPALVDGNQGRAAAVPGGPAVTPSASPSRAPRARAVAPPRAADSAAPAVPRARVEPRKPTVARSAPADAPAQRSRLVVEPLEVWLDSPVALKASPTLSATPSEEPSTQRAEAAALWKSLNTQPQDSQPDTDRLKALEGEVAALRQQAARDREAAAQMQQQAALAEQDRFSSSVVYGLAAVLALALLAVAWLWSRLRNTTEKAVQSWRDSVALGKRDATAAHEEALGLTPQPEDTWSPPETLPHPSGLVAESVHAPLEEFAAAVSASAPVPSAPLASAAAGAPTAPSKAPAVGGVSPAAAPITAHAPTGGQHIVNPEELFDIQQQAEFFISVGEHQQAIEVLRKHIAEHRETSPLAYLELLRLYHTLSRVEEFNQLRAQFMQSFNAQVPEFAGFHRTGRMLYHYTDALAAIEAQWTSSSVLDLLETFLFRRSGSSAVEPFDLAAYDDLLLLLSIAQTTAASARGAPAPRKRTTPLAAPVEPAVVREPPQPLAPEHDLPLDSLAASLEFDFGLPPDAGADFGPSTAPAAAPVNPDDLVLDTRGAPLDLDLSEPPPLTLSDLPPVPVTPPPPAGQPVGFGTENDMMELRLELEPRPTDRK